MMQGAAWLESDFLSEDEARRAAAHALGVPFVTLERDDIAREALELIPEPVSRVHNMVAYHMSHGVVEVALLDLASLQKIQLPNSKVQPRLTDQDSIKRALVTYQKHLKETFGEALQRGEADALIMHALANQASNVHIDADERGTLVRYRIGGTLHEAMQLGTEAGAALVRQVKSLGTLFAVPVVQEGKFKMEKDGETIAVGVSNMPTRAGEKIVLRIARERAGQQGFTLSSLGFHGASLEEIHRVLHLRSGLVVVCGPAGSGKTTTLYTLLDQLAGASTAIASIEETVEYHLPHVAQMQTHPDIGLGLLAGLRAVLRHDPDVVMVSDIRDADVAQLATQAATRGVLVFAVLEAHTAAQALEKLRESIPQELLVQALRGIVAQRLIKKLAPEGRASHTLSLADGNALEERVHFGRVLLALKEEDAVDQHAPWKDIQFYTGAYSGMLGVQEIVDHNGEVKGLNIIEDALFKAAQGLTTIEEVLKVSKE